MPKFNTGYTVHHAKDARWEQGLRDYFQYRDLELSEATNGQFHAQVIRATRGLSGGTGQHKHDVHFHWTYVLKGWVTFHFKGVGEVRLEAGDSQFMPEGCHHELMAFSDDLEMIEMHSPDTIGAEDVPDWDRPH